MSGMRRRRGFETKVCHVPRNSNFNFPRPTRQRIKERRMLSDLFDATPAGATPSWACQGVPRQTFIDIKLGSKSYRRYLPIS